MTDDTAPTLPPLTPVSLADILIPADASAGMAPAAVIGLPLGSILLRTLVIHAVTAVVPATIASLTPPPIPSDATSAYR